MLHRATRLVLRSTPRRSTRFTRLRSDGQPRIQPEDVSDQLIGVLIGACFGFGFTALLQQREFRRRDLQDARERLGLTRAFRADLYSARVGILDRLDAECGSQEDRLRHPIRWLLRLDRREMTAS